MILARGTTDKTFIFHSFACHVIYIMVFAKTDSFLELLKLALRKQKYEPDIKTNQCLDRRPIEYNINECVNHIIRIWRVNIMWNNFGDKKNYQRSYRNIRVKTTYINLIKIRN